MIDAAAAAAPAERRSASQEPPPGQPPRPPEPAPTRMAVRPPGPGFLAAPQLLPRATGALWRRAAPWLRRAAASLPPLERALVARRMRRRMRAGLGYEPDLRNPRTYNEKLAWKIIHDRNPLIRLTTDKVNARDFAAARAGAGVLVPLIGVYDRAADLPWEALPDRFALKASHGSGMNLLVRDKGAADRDAVLRQAEAWLGESYYDRADEWGYRGIRPRLMVEELLLDEDGQVPEDLKFYVFGGRVELLRIHVGRFGAHRVNFYDRELRLLPFAQIYPTDPAYAPRPEVLGLIGTAERLGADFDCARVDLYLVGGRVRFGEITHYDGNACTPFMPPEYDRVLGDMWGEATNRAALRAAGTGSVGTL